MKIKPTDLQIGVKIYQYSSQILEYIITGKNSLDTGKHKEVFYIAECQSCNDHDKCIVAFKLDDHGDLVYSHMLNNYDEDEDYKKEHGHYRNNQYYWHKNENYRFFLSRKEAQKYIIERNISSREESIQKSKDIILNCENEIEKLKTQITILDEK